MELEINKYMQLPFKERMKAIEPIRDTNNPLFKAVMKETQRIMKLDRENAIKDAWKDLKPFEFNYNVPKLPKPLTQYHIDKLIECGAIPIYKLEVGKWYYGKCRNAEKAMWNGKQFEYERTKFNMKYKDKINHFENDNNFDLFVPIKKL